MRSCARTSNRVSVLQCSLGFHHTWVVIIYLLLLAPMSSILAGQPQSAAVTGPVVGKPVAPRVLDANLRALTRTRLVRPWSPGDPVRVIEDLKERLQPAGGSQTGELPGTEMKGPVVREPITPRVLTQDLQEISRRRAVRPWRPGDPVRVIEDLREQLQPSAVAGRAPAAGGAPGEGLALVADFDGIPATGSLPPDTVGDVGPQHYIQMVNTVFAVFDKQGNLLAGPSPINALWSGFGGPCETENNGDPIVRYDHLADRWVISQFALPDPEFYECIAVSRTADPVAGGWFLYEFPTVDTATGRPVFPDYPKIGVWPDGYYMGTQRGFPNGGLDVWVFERDKMLNGDPASVVQFTVPAPSLFLMPSDLDGPAPPAGTPNFFVRQVDGERFGGGGDRLEIFAFSVNWGNPGASTFTPVATLPTQPFDSVLCSADLLGACIPQPGTTQRLETLTVWPMWRLQYRNLAAHESLVINHTVDADGRDHAGIRWYELRRPPSGAWSIFQQGTHAPDAVHRWMGSVAMDQTGNIALGYSVSSDTVFPSMRYAGRLVSDPPGTLPQGEVTLIAGGGSQTHGSRRWGNYSTMDVDPADDCTFWYTNQYYQTTSTAGWRTHVSSFRYPSCGAKERMAFKYAAKIVCGLQRDPKEMRLARGFYATAINIHNPHEETVTFSKKLALTFPPEEQKPGQVIPIAEDQLRADEALEVDCMDIQRRLFPDGFPTPYIKGFVVIQSNSSLDVTAVYTSTGVDERGEVTTHSSIDVEQIHERSTTPEKPPESKRPDLQIRDISRPQVTCPGGPGTCVTTVSITIANMGAGNAGAFNVRIVFDPTQSVIVNQPFTDLAAGTAVTFTATTPRGGNCYDPDCTICVTVDSDNAVEESDEGNNVLCETTPG